jgi:hypothetical protein
MSYVDLPRQAVTVVARAVAEWSRRPSGRLALPGLFLAGAVAVTATAGAVLIPATAAPRLPMVAQADSASSAAGASLPPEPGPTAGPTLGPTGTVPTAVLAGRPADVLAGWAQQVSGKVGVPVVAMQAYGYAELVLAQTTPACRLSWTTLAAIGKVESDHGRANRATLFSDGRALPAIVGLPLDGKGARQLIRDTDAGALDGDRTYDRAVGPMQFIPATWRSYAADADNDGVRDPNDIDDAALAAANYLCQNGRDLSTAAGWWGAVLGYNDVRPYAQAVFAAANDYGERSRT